MNFLKKVLIVDDSPQMHFLYRMILMRYKCDIVSAMTGHEGLIKLAANPDVDLIIVDIQMPIMNGLEFIKAAREHENVRHIPVILVITGGRDENAVRGFAPGTGGVLKKPFTSTELHRLIGSLQSRSGGPATAQKTVNELRPAV